MSIYLTAQPTPTPIDPPFANPDGPCPEGVTFDIQTSTDIYVEGCSMSFNITLDNPMHIYIGELRYSLFANGLGVDSRIRKSFGPLGSFHPDGVYINSMPVGSHVIQLLVFRNEELCFTVEKTVEVLPKQELFFISKTNRKVNIPFDNNEKTLCCEQSDNPGIAFQKCITNSYGENIGVTVRGFINIQSSVQYSESLCNTDYV